MENRNGNKKNIEEQLAQNRNLDYDVTIDSAEMLII